MADPSACRDWYFRPARNAFNFGNKKKSHGATSGGGGGGGGGGNYWAFAIIGRLLCLVAQILLLTFLTGSK